ncbi:preprotein translocase subunit SecY [Candidatus Hydrogenosomobacter endosymbioticus]|uniref:Protein translocase subunit SecY n=1 Tax=Candidatus Hydrogenosomobacter endosymbioticus TaxID=2558174 RepID=A0ABM7V897_9PROT|nr:preprotein translocase subunit SecY [Candidatus Hydrogenosomobacter endosymbioticus]BDB96002.1 protein translocase subunit SecY [Candidatus Hydrogenosomobacter endosymbioticus]
MASVSEQLLSNLSWSAWSKAKDLHKRIWFTLGIFVVYRFGTYIPLPGIDPNELASWTHQYANGILGMFNLVSGGALGRMSIMALNLMPYISASIIVQLMTAIFPHFIALKKEGESGRRKLSQYTRYGTVILASMEAMGIASWISSYPKLVVDSGPFFFASTVVTIVGATLFLMWLGEQITSRGVGNGSSMIIYAGIVAGLPPKMVSTIMMSRAGGVSSGSVMATVAIIMFVVVLIIFVERAYRRVVVQHPKRQVGRQVYSSEQTYMPIKINSTGVLPPIFALAFLSFLRIFAQSRIVSEIYPLQLFFRYFFTEAWLFMLIEIVVIVFFAFFYTPIVFNPDETAENLRKSGGFIPGYRPGKMTAEFFSYLLTRLTVIGAAYISFVVVLPSFLNYMFKMDFPFQGTSFLIAVGVSLDMITQVHSYLIAHQYENLLRRGKR